MEKEKRKRKIKNNETKPLDYWAVVRRFSLQAVLMLLVWGMSYLGYALLNDVEWHVVDDRMSFGTVCSVLITGNFLHLSIYLIIRHVGRSLAMIFILPVMGVSIMMMFAMLWMVGLTIGVGTEWWWG